MLTTRLRLLFRHIHLVIGSGIEDYAGIGGGQSFLDRGGIGNVEVVAVPSGSLIAA
jgi:hypothetical protein